MTRPFRVEADERRYFALRTEFYIRLVSSGTPSQTVHEIMRNFGKLEDMMFFEGVRQGMAAGLLAMDGSENFEALGCHAALYQTHQTPLVRAEKSRVRDLLNDPGYDGYSKSCGKLSEEHPWLDPDPLLFGPSTLTEALEAYGPDLTVGPMPRRERVRASTVPNEPVTDNLPDESNFVLDEHQMSDFLRELEVPEPSDDPEQDQPLERPELLDRIRDILLAAEPANTWVELIHLVQRELLPPIDAGYLDMMLSSPMGMTVLSQCKLFHLHPGSSVSIGPDGVVVTR